MKEAIREEAEIVAAAERQMQTWAMTEEQEQLAIRRRCLDRLSKQTGLFVAVSRESGADGSQIAQLLGERLSWRVLDRELLDQVAERFHVSKGRLELIDETEGNWVADLVGTLLDPATVRREKYVAQLFRVVRSAWREENVVIVGRGAQFLLPRSKGLAVRVIASRKYRIERLMERLNLGATEAAHLMDEVDRGRKDFVSRYFHHDINDSHLYDLVLNVERLGIEGAVTQIVAALWRRTFPRQPDEELEHFEGPAAPR